MTGVNQSVNSLNDGVALFKQGKFEEAIHVFEDQVRNNPEDIQSIGCLAACYSKTGRTDDAVQAFTKLTELQPENAIHYFNLGIAYETADNLDKARECFERVLALNPGHPKAQQRLDAVNSRLNESASSGPLSGIELGSWPMHTDDSTPVNAPVQSYSPPIPAYSSSYEPPIPAEISLYASRPTSAPSGLNWGGFLLPFWWSLAHRAWLWLIVSLFFPIISSIVLLVKGNDIAFENREYSSLEDFYSVQRIWTISGIIVNLFWIGMSFYFQNQLTQMTGISGNQQPVAGTQAGELAATIAELEQLRKDNEQFGGMGQGTVTKGTDANGPYVASTVTMPADLATTCALFEGYVKESGGYLWRSSTNAVDYNIPSQNGATLIHIETIGNNQTTVVTKVYSK